MKIYAINAVKQRKIYKKQVKKRLQVNSGNSYIPEQTEMPFSTIRKTIVSRIVGV